MEDIEQILQSNSITTTYPEENKAMYINPNGEWIILKEQKHYEFDQKYIDKNIIPLRTTGGEKYREIGYIKANSHIGETYIYLNETPPTKEQLNAIFDFFIFSKDIGHYTFVIIGFNGKKWRILDDREDDIVEEIKFIYKVKNRGE